MNDQAQMMNQPSQMMNQSQIMGQSQPLMSMSQPQMLNPQHVMNQKPQMLNQPPLPPQLMKQTQMMMNQTQSQGISQSQMLNRNYGMWPPVDQLKFQNPMLQPSGLFSSKQSKLKPLGRGNWKGKKGNDNRKDGRRKENPIIAAGSSSGVGVGGTAGGGGYKPPSLNDLQYQNRLKARKFYPKKKFNNNNHNNNRSAPFAPRNTTSFIIRAKKSGGIASLVSPCPVTPAVLPTPIFSPSREVLVDMAKEEWGVDGYGSMKGLIRLRSPGNEMEVHEEEEDEEGGGSSESDVEEHVEVERRLDHDLSRFEMIYPNYGAEYNNVLENRVDDQDSHIAQLEEENLILKERLFLMERELGDLRWRLQSLERQNHGVDEVHEEVVENESEEDSEIHGDAHVIEENIEVVEENNEVRKDAEMKEESNGRSAEAKEINNVNVKESENEVVDASVREIAHVSDEQIEENIVVVEENNEVRKDAEMKEESNCRSAEAKEINNVNVKESENDVVDASVKEIAHVSDEQIAEEDEMIVDDRTVNEGEDGTKDDAGH